MFKKFTTRQSRSTNLVTYESIDKYRDNVIYCCKTLDNVELDGNIELNGKN